MTQASAEGDLAGLSASEREMLAVAQRAATRSESGLDDAAFTAILAALREIVPFDRASILVNAETPGFSRLLWRLGDPTAVGMLVPKDERLGKRMPPADRERPEEAPTVAETLSPTNA